VPITNELKNLGIHMVENYEFSHWETCSVSGLVKRTYFSSPMENEAKISIPTFGLFCFRYRRVNDSIVSGLLQQFAKKFHTGNIALFIYNLIPSLALAESYILYQDGIIIDENFLTNDSNIYAAGPATAYKRILLASHQNHKYYQSEEIGQQVDFMEKKKFLKAWFQHFFKTNS
jgi:hypothetical protein